MQAQLRAVCLGALVAGAAASGCDITSSDGGNDPATDTHGGDGDAADSAEADARPTPAPRESCGSGVDDDGDGATDCDDTSCCDAVACRAAPICTTPSPDPAAVAPEIDLTQPTSLADAMMFLTLGDDPVQRGVVPGAIDPRRISLIRGVVLGPDGPLAGVRVDVLGQDALGITVSRADGAYDLVINGGGATVLRFTRTGFVPVQRVISPGVRGTQQLPNVIMTAYDDAVTTVTMGQGAGQVARGNPVSDDSGSRQATVIIPPGTTAMMTLPGGESMPLDSAAIRATELTVGVDGPLKMPAGLPARTAYTYAVELSVDEAMAEGATRVDFDPPLALHVDNFVGFPVGSAVPLGYYDRERGVWVPSDNGRVIEVLGATGGLAEVRIDPPPAGAASAVELAALGIDDSERQQLALLYSAGDTLWRAPIPHFTPWDCNWPYAPPRDATPPLARSPEPEPEEDEDEECRDGSVIGVQSQTLREMIPLAGVPWRLHYSSQRAPGRTTARAIDIPVTPGTVSGGLLYAEAKIDIAGQHHERRFEALPNQQWTFEWDGLDAYGRPLQGAQVARLAVTFWYELEYYAVSADFQWAFDQVLGGPGLSSATFPRSSRFIDVTRESEVRLSRVGAPAFGLGGWSLTPHHVYDPEARVLHMGDGTRRGAAGLAPSITTFVGGEAGTGYGGDGGPAIDAKVNSPSGMTRGPDGAFYFADTGNHRVRRIDGDGIITTVAGNGTESVTTFEDIGDGGHALDAIVSLPIDISFGSDGSLYIAQITGLVRRVAPDGIIETFAGGGLLKDAAAEGAIATEIAMFGLWDVVATPDGAVFISEATGHRVRKVGPDGRIRTWVGGGTLDARTNDVAATDLNITNVWGIDVADDGTMYLAIEHGVLQVSPGGISRVFAGDGAGVDGGDGGLATEGQLAHPRDIAIAPDGTVYIGGGSRIRRVSHGGILSTVAGNGEYGRAIDHVPATASPMFSVRKMYVDPDGVITFDDGVNSNTERLQRIAPLMPSPDGPRIAIPSTGGGEVYVFSQAGRHLETLNGLTGETELTFEYDAAGRIVAIADRFGGRTTVERDGVGVATAIVGPDGRRTGLSVSGAGNLEAVSDAMNQTVSLTYDDGGLLTRLVDRRGGSHDFSYDAAGRLVSDSGPAGARVTLTRESSGSSDWSVTATTAEGRTRQHTVVRGSGKRDQLGTWPSGAAHSLERTSDGVRVTTAPDGTVTTTALSPDPRFGMNVPYVGELTITTPGGRVFSSTTEVSATFPPGVSAGTDPFAFTALTHARTLAGQTWTTRYDPAIRTTTATSPAGRTTRHVTDANGRVVERQVGALAKMTFTYDARGRLVTAAQGRRSMRLTWDERGDHAAIEDAAGATTVFHRDALGRVESHEIAGGLERTFDRDAHGNITSLTAPGAAAHATSFRADDRLARVDPPALGAVETPTTFAYDLDGNLVGMTDGDGVLVSQGYDAAGRHTWTAGPQDDNVTRVFDDVTARVTRVTGPDDVVVTHAYDGPLRTGLSWSGPFDVALSRTYDDSFRVVSETIGQGAPVEMGYDADGRLVSAGPMTLTRAADTPRVTAISAGVVTETFTFNEYGEPASQVVTGAGGAAIWTVAMIRDSGGRITVRTERVANGAERPRTYTYDTLGRLSSLTDNGIEVERYTWDGAGNRRDSGVSAPGSPGEYDAQDRIVAYGDATYSHRGDGARTEREVDGAVTETTYDQLGNLRTVALPDGRVISYVVDGAGRRIGKRVDGSLVGGWIYRNQLGPAAAIDADGAVSTQFVYGRFGHVPELMVTPQGTYRILHDQIGSPRYVVDVATGAVVQELRYSAFGEVLVDTQPGFQPFGFAGGLYDPDTGLVRMGARDYDPEVGRFLSKDPIRFAGGDTNLYAYAGGDPVNRFDPDGRGAAIPLAIAGLIAIYTVWELNEAYEFAEAETSKMNHADYKITDALNHCIASCVGSLAVGQTITAAAGAAKEIGDQWFGDQEAPEMIADLDNNKEGRACSETANSDQDCVDNCQSSLAAGGLNTTDN